MHGTEVDRRRRVDVMRAEPIGPPAAEHGEGAFWDARSQRLLYVDMLAGDVMESGESATPIRHHVGSVAAAIRARASGGYVVALENGFAITDDELAIVDHLPAVFVDSTVRMNDGGCDPQGRFYCGTMAYDMAPHRGTLFRLDTDRRISVALEGVTISNGLQWRDDGELVYYNDTPTGRVDMFDFDGGTGEFHNRRTFVSVPAADGLPDGMAIDAEGGVWIALWQGGAVHRYAPDGSLSEVVTVPARQVTSCAFGGADLGTLFITTSRLGLGLEAEPDAGSVFAVTAGVAGVGQHPYRG